MDRSKTHHGPVCLDPNRQRCSQCSGRRGSVHMGTQVTSARACPARRACQQQHKCGSVHRMRQRRMQPQLAGTVRMLCIRQRPYTLGLDKLCSQAHVHRHPGYLPRSRHNIGDAMAWYNMSHRTRTFSQEYKKKCVPRTVQAHATTHSAHDAVAKQSNQTTHRPIHNVPLHAKCYAV